MPLFALSKIITGLFRPAFRIIIVATVMSVIPIKSLESSDELRRVPLRCLEFEKNNRSLEKRSVDIEYD